MQIELAAVLFGAVLALASILFAMWRMVAAMRLMLESIDGARKGAVYHRDQIIMQIEDLQRRVGEPRNWGADSVVEAFRLPRQVDESRVFANARITPFQMDGEDAFECLVEETTCRNGATAHYARNFGPRSPEEIVKIELFNTAFELEELFVTPAKTIIYRVVRKGLIK